jgi:hypothetical protein
MAKFNYTIEQLVKEAMNKDKRTIKDRLYLLAWVWSRQDNEVNDTVFYEKLGKIYTYLLKHFDPDSVIRCKERILEGDPVLKESYESTEDLRKEIIEQQQPLLDTRDIARQNIRDLKKILTKEK